MQALNKGKKTKLVVESSLKVNANCNLIMLHTAACNAKKYTFNAQTAS